MTSNSSAKLRNPLPFTVTRDRFARHPDAGTRIMARMLGNSYFGIVDFCRAHNIPKFIQPPYGKFGLTMLMSNECLDISCNQYKDSVVIKPEDTRIVAYQTKRRFGNGDYRYAVGIELDAPSLSERIAYLSQQHGTKVRKRFDNNLFIALTYTCDRRFAQEFISKQPHYTNHIHITGETVTALSPNRKGPGAAHDLLMEDCLSGNTSIKTHTAGMMETCANRPNNITAAMVFSGSLTGVVK